MLKKAPWSSLLKGGIFVLSWYWFSGWLIAVLACVFYFIPLLQWRRFIRTFFVFSGVMLVAREVAPALYSFVPYARSGTAVLMGFLFFLLLGVKEIEFQNRQTYYAVLHTALFLMMGLGGFWFAEPLHVSENIWTLVAITIGAIFLFSEFFAPRTMRPEERSPHPILSFFFDDSEGPSRRLMAWVGGLLAAELFWAINLLPIGFLAQSALFASFAVTGRELFIADRERIHACRTILIAVTFILFASLCIFSASRWEF